MPLIGSVPGVRTNSFNNIFETCQSTKISKAMKHIFVLVLNLHINRTGRQTIKWNFFQGFPGDFLLNVTSFPGDFRLFSKNRIITYRPSACTSGSNKTP